ncbi:MAG: hypothetical protein O3A25_17350 [Acidobacteria bacterium]|nr:hypothetical protein [Acidobacteriota bacterium]
MEIRIERLWNGQPARADEQVSVSLDMSAADVMIHIEARFHDDPPPNAPIGSTERLWEHEVVELFLLGDDERYLELEFGPHGHYLGLALRGPRQVDVSGLPLDFSASRTTEHWQGRARVRGTLLPRGLHAFNAYAIHGQGASRRYLAAHPVPGPEPDFHQLRSFAPLPDAAKERLLR